VIKLTLDTNALRDLAWALGRTPERRYEGDPAKQVQVRRAFGAILAKRDLGELELGVTTRLYADFWESRGELPPELIGLIGVYVRIGVPTVFGFPLAFPTSFPDMKRYEVLFRDVFPDSTDGQKHYADNRRDAWQLYAHQTARRDVFVTSDSGILAQAAILRDKWGIRVASPLEFDPDSQP
jgi:hypothetical protein